MILFYDIPPRQIAGVLVEPVVGEAGVWIPPADFFPGLRALCDKHGWVLCADEVQSGFGRCGHMWAIDEWGVTPDLLVVGKGLSGGVMPIAAVTGRSGVVDPADAFVAGAPPRRPGPRPPAGRAPAGSKPAPALTPTRAPCRPPPRRATA